MPSIKDHKFFWLISSIAIILNSVPFWIADIAGGKEFVFDGLLLNPIDGHTYLAKMYQGFQGSWKFTLPYTSDPGQGAYLNGFYLILGHLGRILGLSLPMMFSIARVASGILLLFALYKFFHVTIAATRPRKMAFGLAALGSGMGWILLLAGKFTSDFWVAETYPFLSIYDNPHFPLGLALILWIITLELSQTWTEPQKPAGGVGGIAIASLALSIINPFGVIVVLAALTGWWFYTALIQIRQGLFNKIFQSSQYISLLWVALGGLPLVIYQYLSIRTDPVLSGWNIQNITPTPPVWDVIVSLSPALIFAFLYLRHRFQKGFAMSEEYDSRETFLLVWASAGLALISVPFGLQRRFMMGLFVPIAGLAALGIESIAEKKASMVKVLYLTLFLLSIPTNLIILLAGQSGVINKNLILYRTASEAAALNWLAEETPEESIILASPETGLIIPAFSGRRVIYGHPFETVNADLEKQTVIGIFLEMGGPEFQSFIEVRNIDYVFIGPREIKIIGRPLTLGFPVVFETDDVIIYEVEK